MQLWISGLLALFLATSVAQARDYSRLANRDLRDQLQEQVEKNHRALGYRGARTELLGRISLERTNNGSYVIHDVYCDQDYGSSRFGGGNGPGPGRIPDDRVLNTEHTWPQSRFGGSNKEMQKSDLHHLFPSDSELNSNRGNHPFGEVQKNERPLKCAVSRAGYNDRGEYVFEPPEFHRGNVARALFYFAVRYGMKIDATQEQVLKKWNQQDPVDQEEQRRNDLIEQAQGNRNPFIDQAGLADQIQDF